VLVLCFVLQRICRLFVLLVRTGSCISASGEAERRGPRRTMLAADESPPGSLGGALSAAIAKIPAHLAAMNSRASCHGDAARERVSDDLAAMAVHQVRASCHADAALDEINQIRASTNVADAATAVSKGIKREHDDDLEATDPRERCWYNTPERTPSPSRDANVCMQGQQDDQQHSHQQVPLWGPPPRVERGMPPRGAWKKRGGKKSRIEGNNQGKAARARKGN
jgi:hypothetical protein